VPSERAAALADEFAAANEAAIVLAESCSESQWRTVVPGEEWTVGVVLHHVAEGHAQGARWLLSMAAGDGVADTGDDIDRHNVTHAEQWSDVSVADTVALLRDNGHRTEALLRALTDEELDRTAPFGPAGGQLFLVEQLAAVASGHPRGHLAHAQKALDASGRMNARNT
jgi:DinB superfamily